MYLGRRGELLLLVKEREENKNRSDVASREGVRAWAGGRSVLYFDAQRCRVCFDCTRRALSAVISRARKVNARACACARVHVLTCADEVASSFRSGTRRTWQSIPVILISVGRCCIHVAIHSPKKYKLKKSQLAFSLTTTLPHHRNDEDPEPPRRQYRPPRCRDGMIT